MSNEIPEPWRTASARKGIAPSYRNIADAARISHETVRRLIRGRPTSKSTMQAVADALGVDVETIHEWRGARREVYEREFTPDEVSYLLTDEEREVVNSLIRLLARNRIEQEERDGDDSDAAPITALRDDAPPIPPIGRVAARRGKKDDPHAGLGDDAIDEPGSWDGA